MWLYLLIFAIVIVIYSETARKPRDISVLALCLGTLAVFVGISDMLGGYDRYIYGEVFDFIADIKGNYRKNGAFNYFGGEIGWTYLNIFISFFTKNRYIFILIITLITYFMLFISFKKHLSNYAFGLILFLGLWFFFSFTYLRQVLGASVVWLSIPYILKRDLKRFLIIVFIAYTIHNSAIIFVPLYFIPIKKFNRQTVIILSVVTLILGLSGFPSTLFDAYSSLSATTMERVNRNAIAETQGTRLAYLAEVLFFMYLILTNYKKFPNNRKTLLLLNMALTFCLILLLFIRSDNGGRLSWYFMIGLISTLTYVSHKKGNLPIAKLLIFVSLLLYLRIYISWQAYNNLYPYKTFFTNGHRTPDYSYENYEYDANYDKDKFYR